MKTHTLLLKKKKEKKKQTSLFTIQTQPLARAKMNL